MLTDENLLLPLLHALPEKAGGINVTMGYPIKTTLAYAFLERLVELQAHRREGREGRRSIMSMRRVSSRILCCAECAANDRELRRTMLADRRIRMTADELGQTPLLRRFSLRQPSGGSCRTICCGPWRPSPESPTTATTPGSGWSFWPSFPSS